jgi:GTPase SAR1 family protein
MSNADEFVALAAKYVNTTDRHIFLTGRAGTGKTTFLKSIIQQTFKNTVVAAPTGIAAINAGGVTLHSLLQLPLGVFIPENIHLTSAASNINTPDTIFRNLRINSSKRHLIQHLELLIIDEVSMLRADVLDCADTMLRHLRRNRDVPFGGLQILFIGDLLQLPPVVKDEDKILLNKYYDSPYFFDAHALKNNQPIKVELQKVYRQSDDRFIGLLNRFRNNSHTADDLHFLNKFHKENAENEEHEGYIHLTTHNYRADQINRARLQQLTGKSYRYAASVTGDFKEHLFPTNETLEFKKDAQVMFIKNDLTGEGRFFNGKIGRISFLDSSGIYVLFEDGSKVKVDHYVWENKRYSLHKDTNEVEEKFLGKFEQYPIKLAWAVTVHKSQGLTFEKAILDLSGTFAPGQLYVALSRLTSLDGLILSSRIPQNPPGIDQVLKDFSTKQISEKQLSERLVQDRKGYIISSTEKTFNFDHILKNLYFHRKSFNKDENRSIKQQYLPWTNELIENTRALHDVGIKFINQVKGIIDQDNYINPLNERMEKAWKYFEKELSDPVSKIADHIALLKGEKRVKEYANELQDLEALFHLQINQMFKLHLFIQCASKNTVLSKKDLYRSELKNKPGTIKKTRKEKTPTTEISFNLFKEGKTIEEIANERGLVKTTIEGHLYNYVENGEIDILKLLEKKKLDRILKRYEKGIEGLAELKSDLGDDFSYSEIKLALAHDKFLKQGK